MTSICWSPTVCFGHFFFKDIHKYVFEIHLIIGFYVLTTHILNTPYEQVSTLNCADNHNTWYFTNSSLRKAKRQAEKKIKIKYNAGNFSLTLPISYFPKVIIFLSWIKGLIKLAVIKVTKLHDKWQIFNNVPFQLKTPPEVQDDNSWEEALSLPVTNFIEKFEICAMSFNLLMHSGIRLIMEDCCRISVCYSSDKLCYSRSLLQLYLPHGQAQVPPFTVKKNPLFWCVSVNKYHEV